MQNVSPVNKLYKKKIYSSLEILLFSCQVMSNYSWTPMDHSIPGFSVPHHLPEFAQVHVHCFPDGSAGNGSTCNARDLGSIPGLGRSPEEGNSYPLKYSGLENSIDCIVHGVTKSQTRLRDFHFQNYQVMGK